MHSNNYLKPATRSITIEASPEKVWEVISTPGILEHTHPFCKSNTVEKWKGKNSVDNILYYSGLRYQRIFTAWNEKTGYELLIGKKNEEKSKVVWGIREAGNNSSILSITIYPFEISTYPKLLLPAINLVYIGPMLRKYLSSVLKGFDYYITKGKAVKKNQFGFHKWFTSK